MPKKKEPDVTDLTTRVLIQIRDGLHALREETRQGLADVRGEVHGLNARLDGVVGPALRDHSRRIDRLERKVFGR